MTWSERSREDRAYLARFTIIVPGPVKQHKSRRGRGTGGGSSAGRRQSPHSAAKTSLISYLTSQVWLVAKRGPMQLCVAGRRHARVAARCCSTNPRMNSQATCEAERRQASASAKNSDRRSGSSFIANTASFMRRPPIGKDVALTSSLGIGNPAFAQPFSRRRIGTPGETR